MAYTEGAPVPDLAEARMTFTAVRFGPSAPTSDGPSAPDVATGELVAAAAYLDAETVSG